MIKKQQHRTVFWDSALLVRNTLTCTAQNWPLTISGNVNNGHKFHGVCKILKHYLYDLLTMLSIKLSGLLDTAANCVMHFNVSHFTTDQNFP